MHAVIAGRRADGPVALRPADGDFGPDRRQQRFLAHRLHDAGRPQHGQSADDAETGIEGLLRQRLPFRNPDDDLHAGRIQRKSGLLRSLPDLPLDHPAGCAVDGRPADRLIESGLRHTSHALAAVKMNAGFLRDPHIRADHHPVRHVRVVAAVLTNRTAGKTGSAQNIQHVQRQGDSFRRIQLNRIRFFSGKKHHCCCF